MHIYVLTISLGTYMFTFAVSWLQVDKGISSEVVRSILTERANWPCLAAKSSYKVSNSSFYYLDGTCNSHCCCAFQQLINLPATMAGSLDLFCYGRS